MEYLLYIKCYNKAVTIVELKKIIHRNLNTGATLLLKTIKTN